MCSCKINSISVYHYNLLFFRFPVINFKKFFFFFGLKTFEFKKYHQFTSPNTSKCLENCSRARDYKNLLNTFHGMKNEKYTEQMAKTLF